jgi:hypothetical protein
MMRLNQWLSGLLQERGADLFRSKGILVVDGCDERCARELDDERSELHPFRGAQRAGNSCY